MPKNLIELVKEEDFDSFLQNNRLVLVKFSASWCPPCRELQKNIEKLLGELEKSTEQSKDLMVLQVDADKFPQLVSKEFDLILSVSSIPTFFLFHRGKMIKEEYGNRSVQQLKEFINI